MGIIDLVLKEKVDLDAEVGRYLPGAAAPARNVTIRQLLVHSSGMPEYCGGDFDPLTLEQLLSDCMGRPLRFEPGSRVAYSNPGYSVLGAVVEKVSGRELEAYLREEILGPSGLEGIAYRPTGGPLPAHGYLGDRDQGVISERIAGMKGAFWALKGNGGMQASARDMFGWYEALSGRRALSEDHRDLAIAPRIPNGEDNWNGYGWNIGLDEAGEIDRVSHAGSDGVFFAYFWWNPGTDRFFYLVGNAGEERTIEAVRATRRIMSE